jgi:nucleotide-binding universal stress UspA family protein
MPFKEILVHLDAHDSTEARLKIAIQLAQRHEAQLHGLYILSHTVIPAYTEVMVGIEHIEAQLAELAQKQADQIKQWFVQQTEAAQLNAQWHCLQGEPIEITSRYARYCDLVIMGQEERSTHVLAADGLVDHIILMAGTPVLVVPYIGPAETLGERIMIAWNGSREGIRAVRDALPILQQAKRVEIATVDVAQGDRLSQYLRNYLAVHHIKAQTHQFPARDIEPGALLLSRVAEEGIDLMVMGAYGHSRFRELMLGGVTLHVLKQMTVPVFMSH